jgi:7-carboxy-7-deazaguanine synthase
VDRTLIVNELFLSIQGEGTRAGLPCTLVRLTGCNLRCRWCDTPYARQEGAEMDLEDILRRVGELGCPRVEVTGGEPLLQPAALDLLSRLCEAGYQTLLETNGSLDVSPVDPRVVRIVDVKCPSSGESSMNRWENLRLLNGRDEVKFVLADRADYEFARKVLAEHNLLGRCAVIFSPVGGGAPGGELPPAQLAEWILADRLDVRLGLQLHKILWPGRDRGV